MSFLGIDPNQDIFNQISGTSQPQYQSVDLDQGTKGLIQGAEDRGLNQPYKSSNIDQSASMFMPKGPTQAQASGGLISSPGTGQAIANKYAAIAGEHIQGLKNQQNLSDQEQQFKKTGMAFNQAMMQQQVQNQNYEAYIKQIKDEQNTRGQTLNAIFSAGGQIGGAYAGSHSGKGGGGGGNNPMPGSSSGNRSSAGGDDGGDYGSYA